MVVTAGSKKATHGWLREWLKRPRLIREMDGSMSDHIGEARRDRGTTGLERDMGAIGDNIQARRAVRGLSQAALAEELGISRQSVAKWESGKSRPDLERMARLCDLFGCTMDELVYGSASATVRPGCLEPPPDVPAGDGEAGSSEWGSIEDTSYQGTAARAYEHYATRRCLFLASGCAVPVLGLGVAFLCVGLGVSRALAAVLWMLTVATAGLLLRMAHLERHEMMESYGQIAEFHTLEQRHEAHIGQTITYSISFVMFCAAFVCSYAGDWMPSLWWPLSGLTWILLAVSVFLGVASYQRGRLVSTQHYNGAVQSETKVSPHGEDT